ncbi:MAG TPA: ribonuclease E inhibitor RraB [Gaiellaceae bacterium]|nr:ribonuclease E inhibitor RraB [Gaiellaceae bacterium]
MGLLDRLGGRAARRPRTPADEDALALRELARRGADLARPRHVVHFLSFPDEVAARAAAAEAERAGWETSLSPPGERLAQWRLQAEAVRVVDELTVRGFRAQLGRLAAAHGGAYDGWEAARRP